MFGLRAYDGLGLGAEDFGFRVSSLGGVSTCLNARVLGRKALAAVRVTRRVQTGALI